MAYTHGLYPVYERFGCRIVEGMEKCESLSFSPKLFYDGGRDRATVKVQNEA